jgi:two-component system chemotaxis response regulator CheY
MARGPILVVDDDEDIREAVRDHLERSGYDVTLASSAAGALARLKAGLRPAVMLVDYLMPGGTGVDLIVACRQTTTLGSIPAILMSGSSPDDLPDSGVVLSLRKPFSSDELLTKIRRAIAHSWPACG